MKVKEDSVEYSFTGVVMLLNPKVYFRITALDTIDCQLACYIPNSLCPNCEFNDVFMPQFGCPPLDYEMILFDRWGNVIFESHEPDKGWDGNTSDGSHAQTDIYVCRLKWRYYEGDERHTAVRYVTLIR